MMVNTDNNQIQHISTNTRNRSLSEFFQLDTIVLKI